ncbi:hypothetical protein NCAS_0B08850 [Naumovozyma castellii]|uniref:Peptide-methionine (R)-S-oxide reductase n=1 Tax=Naumovozyma castellii TaxID=27288 RepID=G0VAU2_NAUCA|nr:hypothetical protein NCAS_0B08850 [Naumovozyma castellii CBS 4309]CCC68969.1 hypothetical protein NCAS_0B08850 [Naumovozyma castellii CBS 4309]
MLKIVRNSSKALSIFTTRHISSTRFVMSSNNTSWNPSLSKEQLAVLRDKGTEPANSGKYLHNKETGVYTCANCGNALYKSDTKFDSQCGWPSFYKEFNKDSLKYNEDVSHGMQRIEVTCQKCGGHLGHVFKGEGWTKSLGLPIDERHCINSLSLNFKKV